MARSKRVPSPTGIYHWITRGINKKHLFHRPDDYLRFKELLSEYKAPNRILIYHYCLMTNHIHLLLQSPDLEALGRFSYYVLRRYTYYYSKFRGWSGSLFQKGYKSYPVEKETYLLECGRYIERNPTKAGLSTTPGDYRYSSYKYYVDGSADALLTPSPAFCALSDEESERRRLYTDYVNQIRIVDEMVGEKLISV